jgi:hypothetical protein
MDVVCVCSGGVFSFTFQANFGTLAHKDRAGSPLCGGLALLDAVCVSA